MPLHAKLAAKFRVRIASGGWMPGERLPTEFQLAAEYGVSRMTLRDALLVLDVEGLIVRRKGGGTRIARHDRDETRSRLPRLVGPDGARLAPNIHVLENRIQRATLEQAARLGVKPGTRLRTIRRLRILKGQAAIFERISIPAALVPGLPVVPGGPMSEELYAMYQERFGITIGGVSERLAAVAATAEEAGHLDVAPGAPLLEVTRVATDLIGWAVELRISRCDPARVRYAAEVF